MQAPSPRPGLPLIFLLLILTLCAPGAYSLPAQSQIGPAQSKYIEDINRDGRVDITDVIALLLMARESPADPQVDYNGNGAWSVADAVALLLNLRSGDLHLSEPSADSWRVLGPGGGGSMFLPTINPNDPDNVLVRCDMTGAYVTFDNAASWSMFNLRTVVYDFEYDVSTPGTVYAGNTGLYRSTDNGLHWRLIYPDPGNIIAERMEGDHAEQWFETTDGMPDRSIIKVKVDPANSDHIWLTFSGAGPEKKILVSHDRGASWGWINTEIFGNVLSIFPGSWWDKPDELIVITDRSSLLITEETGEVVNLNIPPQTPFMEAKGGKGENGVILYALAGSEYGTDNVYRSTDLGSSWQKCTTSLLEGADLITLAVCEQTPEVAYLSCGYFTGEGGLREFGNFKTSDAGQTWSWVYRATADIVLSDNFAEGWMDRDYGPIWREYAWSLGACPTDPDICYASDWGGTIRTLDGGATWEQVYTNMLPDGSASSRGLDVTTCYGVHFDPFDADHIFITYTDIGLFHSTDGGESWLHSIEGIPSDWENTCYWLEFDPEVENRIWSVWANCHDLPRPKMMRSGKLAQGGYAGGVAVSEDGGRSWRTTNSGIPSNTVCTHIDLDPTSPVDSRTLYVCGFSRGVYKSIDGGGSWSEASSGLGTNRNAWRITRLPDGTLFLLVARGLESYQISEDYVGSRTVDGVLYSSSDEAASWQVNGLPERVNAPNDLVFDPSDPQRMYLSCWPSSEKSGGLFRTEDGGNSWRQVFRIDAHVYAAAVDPACPSTVYINTFDSAAFRSIDRGLTWHRLKGYTFKWGHRPVVDPHHPGMLYLTTFGGSVSYGPATGVPGALEDIVNLPDQWRWGDM